MLLLIQLNVIFILFFIFWEDQRQLALPVWIFFPLFFNWTGVSFFQTHWIDWLSHGLLNTFCVSIALALLYVYANWRFGHFINTVFGMGDVIFLYIFAWAYPTPIFLGTWLAGTVASLLIARVLKLKIVPYAGGLALFNATMMLIQLPPLSLINLYDYIP